MLEWTLFPLITGTLLELIANFITLATSFLRPTTTRRALSATAPIAFGGCGLGVLDPRLVLLRNTVPVFPQSFTDDEVLHGLVKKIIGLFMGFHVHGCTVKHLNVIFQQLTWSDLSQQDVP
jgi:hypothetical protein